MTTGVTERVGAVTRWPFSLLREFRREWVFRRAVALGRLDFQALIRIDGAINTIDRDLLC